MRGYILSIQFNSGRKTFGRTALAFFCGVLLISLPLSAQFDCTFSSSTSISTYSTIIGQSGNGSFSFSPASIWDNASGPILISPSFSFNGTPVTTCNFSSNGYLWFGTGANPATNATASNVLGLADIGAGNIGVIAAFARDLGEHPSLLAAPVPLTGGFGRRIVQYRYGGVVPNRYTVIEFAGFFPQLTGSGCTGGSLPDNHRVDFQIKLYENNVAGLNPNRIEIIHRDQTPFCNDSPYSFQVGVRGIAPTEFICRQQNGGDLTSTSSSPGTSNSDQIVFNAGDHVAEQGATFIFDQTGVALTVSPATPSICNGESVVLTASGGANYVWSPAGGLSTTTGATVTASPTTATTYTVSADLGNCTASKTVTVNVTDFGVLSIEHIK
jgi:hypothetical protein